MKQTDAVRKLAQYQESLAAAQREVTAQKQAIETLRQQIRDLGKEPKA